MAHYETLSETICARMEQAHREKRNSPYAFDDAKALRRDPNPHDEATVSRPDINRAADKNLN